MQISYIVEDRVGFKSAHDRLHKHHMFDVSPHAWYIVEREYIPLPHHVHVDGAFTNEVERFHIDLGL